MLLGRIGVVAFCIELDLGILEKCLWGCDGW